MIDERDIRETLRRRAGAISAVPTDPPAAIRRARRRLMLTLGVTSAAGLLLVVGAVAAASSLLRATEPTPAVPPTEEAFVGVWTSVDAEGNARLLHVRGPVDGSGPDHEIHLYVDDAAACGGGVATGSGIGAVADEQMTITSQTLTCADGTPIDVDDVRLDYDRQRDALVDSLGASWIRPLAHARDPDPQSSGGPDAGIWPQSTVEEAVEAQRLADAGDPRYTWQRDDHGGGVTDGQQVALAFVDERLGLDYLDYFEPAVPGRGAYGAFITFTFALCEPGPNPAYPSMPDCAPADGDRFSAIDVTVEQLARGGPRGIWVVTGWGSSDFRQAAPPSGDEVRRLFESYLGARLAGSGAEAYLTSSSAGYWEDRLYLYTTSGGSPFVGFEIDVSEPEWPSGWVYATVRLTARDGTVVEESDYRVGPEEIASGEIGFPYFFTVEEIEAP
jgi:hypothetical protein